MVAKPEQQLAGICSLLGARSHQTEGNPARRWQGRGSHWGAGGLGVSGSQSRGCQGSGPCVPWQLPEQGPPSPAVGPSGPSPSPSPSQEVSDPMMLPIETPRKPWVYFVPTSKCLCIPPPRLAVPGWAALARSAAWNLSLPARQ